MAMLNNQMVICYSSLLNMAHRKFVDLPNFKMVEKIQSYVSPFTRG